MRPSTPARSLALAFRLLALSFGIAVGPAASRPARADAPATCSFDLPEGAAEKTLKAFSEQSGRSLIVVASVTAGVRTHAVRGEFTPREALGRMLAGTGLVGIEDPKNGAFSVRREKDDGAKGRRNPEGAVNGMRAGSVYPLPLAS